MKYDDAKWHAGGDFPAHLDPEHACTHIAFFMGWVVLRKLTSELFLQSSSEQFEKMITRKLDVLTMLHQTFDDKIMSDYLNDECDQFAAHYYESNDYFGDYADNLAENLDSPYSVDATWENFERMVKILDARFEQWRSKQRDRPLNP